MDRLPSRRRSVCKVLTDESSSGWHFHDRVRRLQEALNRPHVQAFYAALALSHFILCVLINNADSEPDPEIGAWMWGTYLPLVLLTAFELLVRVSAQGSAPPHHLSAWRQFYMPLFHKLELLVLVAMVPHVCTAAALLSMDWEVENTARGQLQTADALLACTLPLYRALRAWGIFYQVSVLDTKQKRQAAKHTATVWWQDHEAELAAYEDRLVVSIEKVVDDPLVQWLIFVMLLLQISLLIASGASETVSQECWVSEAVGCIIVFVGTVEFMVRCIAQGGEQFFLPRLHVAEVFVLACSFFLICFAVRNHWATDDPCEGLVGRLRMVVVFPLSIHRLIRSIGVHYRISGSHWQSHSIMSAQAAKVMDMAVGDVLEVPPENIRVKYHHGNAGIEIIVEKAKLRFEAFTELHLPIEVKGGLVEA